MTVLSAHEAILSKSPWFAAKCSEFPAGGPGSHAQRENGLGNHTNQFYSAALRLHLTTLWQLDPSSNTSTTTSTFPGAQTAAKTPPSNTIQPFPHQTTRVSHYSATHASTPSPTSSVSQLSNLSLTPRSTDPTRMPRESSHTHASCTRRPILRTLPFASQSLLSGLPGLMCLGTRLRESSAACVSNSHSSVSTFFRLSWTRGRSKRSLRHRALQLFTLDAREPESVRVRYDTIRKAAISLSGITRTCA